MTLESKKAGGKKMARQIPELGPTLRSHGALANEAIDAHAQAPPPGRCRCTCTCAHMRAGMRAMHVHWRVACGK